MGSKITLGAVIGTLFLVGIAAAPAAAAATDDACSLLTKAQVSTAVNVPVGEGTYVTPTFHKTCTWTPASGDKVISAVTLYLQTADAYDGGKRMAEQMVAMAKMQGGKDASQSGVTSASGVGDDAYYFNAGTLTSLLVKKGSMSFKVSVYAHLPVEKKEAMEKTLALEVLSKL
jgi:hypothetical protein